MPEPTEVGSERKPEAPQASGGLASPEGQQRPGRLKRFSEALDPYKNLVLFVSGVIALFVAVAGVIGAWNHDLQQAKADAVKETHAALDPQIAQAQTEIKLLKEELGNLRSRERINEAAALRQFYWVCKEQEGVIDTNQKTCTFLKLLETERFKLLDPPPKGSGLP